MSVQVMLSLKQDFPDIADEIIVVASSDGTLKEALVDYEDACTRMNDNGIRADERVHWAEIRAELVAEIRRVYLRLK
jgi:hypothetical protein